MSEETRSIEEIVREFAQWVDETQLSHGSHYAICTPNDDTFGDGGWNPSYTSVNDWVWEFLVQKGYPRK